MTTAYLLMWLEAPLQSWGFDSKFGRRDTLEFPTKSGILGLLCCARGAGGPQREWLAEVAPLNQTVLAFVRQEPRSTQKAHTRFREPLLRDFHMVGSGYDEQDPWQKLLIPKTSEGKPAVGGGVKLTYRYYLQDMAFAVAVEVPADQAEALHQALLQPVWDLYLGRKSCVPTDLIARNFFPSHESALEKAQEIAREKHLIEDFRVLQGEQKGDEVFTLNDVPIQFGEHKLYRDRRVTRCFSA